MDRYIDTKYLMNYFAQDEDYYGPDVRADIEDNMPTIDIVRCAECEHYHVEKYHAYCDTMNIKGKFPPDPELNDFCSYGQKSEQILSKRNKTERMTIVSSLLAGIYGELLEEETDDIDGLLQIAVYAQVTMNRIVYELNELNGCKPQTERSEL